MKTLLSLFAIGVITVYLLLPLNALAAPAKAQGEKATQVEELLKYLTYTAEGDGEKVLYVICGPRCPRCAMMYEAFAAEAAVNPLFNKTFQIRWVLYPTNNPNDLFPLENKPGASIKELFTDMGSQQTRVVDNPAHLERLAGYNNILHSSLSPLFEGSISGRYTPFIIFKTVDGFLYGSMEDFRGESAMEIFGAALTLAAGVDISTMLSTMDGAETLSGQIFFAVGADVPLRLFPRDDAPLTGIAIPKNQGASAMAKIKDDWIGVQVKTNPNEPLLYVKLQNGKLKKQ